MRAKRLQLREILIVVSYKFRKAKRERKLKGTTSWPALMIFTYEIK